MLDKKKLRRTELHFDKTEKALDTWRGGIFPFKATDTYHGGLERILTLKTSTNAPIKKDVSGYIPYIMQIIKIIKICGRSNKHRYSTKRSPRKRT